MLPYESRPDESNDYPDNFDQLFFEAVLEAQTTDLPLSGYWNVSIVDGDPSTPGDYGLDRDFFVLSGLAPGAHVVAYLPDYALSAFSQPEAAGGWGLYELNYRTVSYDPDFLEAVPVFLGFLESRFDTEAQQLSIDLDAPDDVPQQYEYAQIGFSAREPGVYRTVEHVGLQLDNFIYDPNVRWTENFHHAGKYMLYGQGHAIDFVKLASEFGTATPGSGTMAEQAGAGRYLITIDEYLGARDREWGPGWFDVLSEAGPETGKLTVAGLDWVEAGEGTWSATGNATIGLRGGPTGMLSVTNGTFMLTRDALTIEDGNVASVIEGGAGRDLFYGSVVALSLDTARGAVEPKEMGGTKLTLGGLPVSVPSLALTPSGVVLEDTTFGLPGEFADLPVRVSNARVTISRDGVQIDDYAWSFGTGADFLRLLNLVKIRPSLLEIEYSAARDELNITGKVQIGEESFFPDHPVDASLKGGIKIAGGAVADVDIAIDQVIGIKGYGFTDLEFNLNAQKNEVKGSGQFLLPFPKPWDDQEAFILYPALLDFYLDAPNADKADQWGIGVGLDFQVDPFAFDGFGLTAVLPSGIPMWTWPFELREIGVRVENLATENRDPVKVTGRFGLEEIENRFVDTKLTFEGSVSVNEGVSGSVEGHFFAEDLFRFEGEAKLDLRKDRFEGSLEATFIDGVVTATLKLNAKVIDDDPFIWVAAALGTGRAQFLGAELTASVYLSMVTDGDPSNDYVAFWHQSGTSLPFVDGSMPVFGVKYYLDGTGRKEPFGAQGIPAISSWSVDGELEDLMVTVQWSNAASEPVRTRVIVYDDLAKTQVRRIVEDSQYASNGIAVIGDWGGPLGMVVYIAAPEPGLWDVEVLNPEGLGLIEYSATTSLPRGTLSLDVVAQSIDAFNIDYTAIDPNGAGELRFFADDDPGGYDGIMIGDVKVDDDSGRFVWDASAISPGRYWIYAVLEDGPGIPVADYASQPVRVGLPVDRSITGTSGDDLLYDEGGDNTIDGGAGLDTAVYSTRHAAYTVTAAGGGWSVGGADGTDTLTSIERLQFLDAHLAFDTDGNAGQVYRLYKAAFARTPDLGGLGGWIAGMDSGLSLNQVANSFLASAEFQNLYGASSSNGQFVTALYLNVMGRAPDAGGYGYWVNQLASSLQTRAQVLVAFSESAENKSATASLTANGILYASAEQASGPARGQLWSGTSGADTLMGSVGADTLDGGAGNDNINGGAGIDISLYGGNRSTHTVTRTADGLTVSGGMDGSDTLVNVERLKFADIALAFDLDGNAGQVYRLYQAAFDRTPDTAGLSDWLRGMDAGLALTKVASGFIGSAEFQGLYGVNPTNTQFIDLLYANVLNRAADQAGYDYWSQQMNAGMTRELVLIGFSESTENQAALLPVIQGGIGYLA